MDGKLICIEGIDGAGKETQTRLLRGRIESLGIKTSVYTYPDYGSIYGRILKDFLDKKIELDVDELFFLHVLDKVKDLKRLGEDLRSGKTVLADRYVMSTVAYQCGGGFDYERGKAIIGLSGLPLPDLVVYLDVSVGVSMERKSLQKAGRLDRFEREAAYLNKVKGIYNSLYAENFFSKRWIRLDGEEDGRAVHEKVFSEVGGILKGP